MRDISEYKSEPEWMLDFRLKALEHFGDRPTPTWGGNLAQIDWDNIHYFVRASDKAQRDWDDVPEDIKNTFDRLGIPEAERKFLAGVGAQYESEVVYHQIREDLEQQGVIFMDMDSALREHEDIVREHWATGDPAERQQARGSELGGVVGRLVRLRARGRQGRDAAAGLLPHQHREHGPVRAHADHRRGGLGRHLHRGLHRPRLLDRLAALGGRRDRRASPSAKVRYTTVQNWSQNVFNLVTKRAVAQERATMEWVDCNLGSKLTMKYPSIYLLGPEAHGEILSIAFAGNGQHQDAGGKIIHGAPKTTSSIFAKSISKDGGRGTYRGLLEVAKGAPRRARRSSATRCCSTSSRAPTPTRRSASTRTTPTSATRPRSRRSARSSSSTSRPTGSTRRRLRR